MNLTFMFLGFDCSPNLVTGCLVISRTKRALHWEGCRTQKIMGMG